LNGLVVSWRPKKHKLSKKKAHLQGSKGISRKKGISA